jgi:two-component system, cell cycle sensor histidine kinase and response regulator CckA
MPAGTVPTRWLIIVVLTLLHPVLLYFLFPQLGEASNLVVFIGPVTASFLVSWRTGFLVLPINVMATAVVFTLLREPGVLDPHRGFKATASALVVAVLCLLADKVRRMSEQRKQLTEELAQAKKMEAIGRLAGGIAHDMNNTLNAIMGSVFAHRQELVQYGRPFKDLEHIAAACDRGAQLTQNLLGFARKSKLSQQVFSLNRVAATTELLLVRTRNKNIRIVTKLSREEPLMEGDRSQIENAVMNLCLNGIDSMETEGTLLLETGRDGHRSYLKVSDTGVGMSREIQAQVFEPFFTTKEEGKGTGLGLSMVYGAVHAMNGSISLKSRPGKGTEITLIFPASCEAANDREVSDVSSRPAEHLDFLRGRSVLLVDDEPLVLRAGIRMLKALGCIIHSACDGEAAIAIVKEHRREISLVVVDLAMPRMDGIETMEAIHGIESEMPVIVVSGYVKDAARLATLKSKRHIARFLSKPYRAEQLLGEAEQLLGPRPVTVWPNNLSTLRS